MNIFVLSNCPKEAAKMHCDKHVVKMCLESVQMLCSVFYTKGYVGNIPYKLTHKNHPCSIWARNTENNFNWILEHSRALFDEYTKRYKKIHKSQKVLEWCEKNKTVLSFFSKDLEPFPIAIADDKLCRKVEGFDKKDRIEQYRLYYIFDKPFAVWNHSETPSWFLEMNKIYKPMDIHDIPKDKWLNPDNLTDADYDVISEYVSVHASENGNDMEYDYDYHSLFEKICERFENKARNE